MEFGLEILMSKPRGHLRRQIASVFEKEPDGAFTMKELCDRVYGSQIPVEQWKRDTVAREAKRVCERSGKWSWCRSKSRGGLIVFFNSFNVISYATGQLKSDWSNHSGSHSIRDMLSPGGKFHERIVPGGIWWRITQQQIATGDPDPSERAKASLEMQEEADRFADAVFADLELLRRKPKRGNGAQTLRTFPIKRSNVESCDE